MGKLEGENKVMMNCKHRETQKAENNVKELSIYIRYEEYERIIKCGEQHDNNEKPAYIRSDEKLLVNGDEINPVDCEECKKMVLYFLTSVVFHPNPNQVLGDMYDKISSLRKWVEGNREVNAYFTVYEIVNNVERHYMSRDKEWSVTWVDYRRQQPRHPKPARVMERVKMTEEGFTCAICLQEVNNKGTKRKRSDVVDDGESNSGFDCTRRVVVRLLSCKHVFHKSCIDQWLKDGGHDTCPLCRFQLPSTVRCGFDWDLAKKKALDNSKHVKTDYDSLCTCI